jgi:hypothetical protein
MRGSCLGWKVSLPGEWIRTEQMALFLEKCLFDSKQIGTLILGILGI